jgi:LPS O-antigen subunit length determinant protein (WzzB/FepE family)
MANDNDPRRPELVDAGERAFSLWLWTLIGLLLAGIVAVVLYATISSALQTEQ